MKEGVCALHFFVVYLEQSPQFVEETNQEGFIFVHVWVGLDGCTKLSHVNAWRIIIENNIIIFRRRVVVGYYYCTCGVC